MSLFPQDLQDIIQPPDVLTLLGFSFRDMVWGDRVEVLGQSPPAPAGRVKNKRVE